MAGNEASGGPMKKQIENNYIKFESKIYKNSRTGQMMIMLPKKLIRNYAIPKKVSVRFPKVEVKW